MRELINIQNSTMTWNEKKGEINNVFEKMIKDFSKNLLRKILQGSKSSTLDILSRSSRKCFLRLIHKKK